MGFFCVFCRANVSIYFCERNFALIGGASANSNELGLLSACSIGATKSQKIMIDTNQLSALVSAFRVETEKESISPEPSARQSLQHESPRQRWRADDKPLSDTLHPTHGAWRSYKAAVLNRGGGTAGQRPERAVAARHRGLHAKARCSVHRVPARARPTNFLNHPSSRTRKKPPAIFSNSQRVERSE